MCSSSQPQPLALDVQKDAWKLLNKSKPWARTAYSSGDHYSLGPQKALQPKESFLSFLLIRESVGLHPGRGTNLSHTPTSEQNNKHLITINTVMVILKYADLINFLTRRPWALLGSPLIWNEISFSCDSRYRYEKQFSVSGFLRTILIHLQLTTVMMSGAAGLKLETPQTKSWLPVLPGLLAGEASSRNSSWHNHTTAQNPLGSRWHQRANPLPLSDMKVPDLQPSLYLKNCLILRECLMWAPPQKQRLKKLLCPLKSGGFQCSNVILTIASNRSKHHFAFQVA